MSARARRYNTVALPPAIAWAFVRRAEAQAAGASDPAAGADRVAWFARAGDVLVEHARGEGDEYELVELGLYRKLKPRARPPAFCPTCLERVWMKLGPQKRPHYAHAVEGSSCLAAGAEGALHLSAKMHIAAELRRVSGIGVERMCLGSPWPGREPCGARDCVSWVDGWDEVVLERGLPSLRADLLLLRKGQAVAAIEVFSTHAVDDVKAAKYRGVGMPWVEVPADAIIAPGGPAWDASLPLPVMGDGRIEPVAWRCRQHAAEYEGWAELERNGVHRMCSRLVHLYWESGAVKTVRVSMLERREGGEFVEAWLEREDSEEGFWKVVRGCDRETARRKLHDQFRHWITWTRKTRRGFPDSPMRWMGPDTFPKKIAKAQFPQRARWDQAEDAFILPANVLAVSWPVQRGRHRESWEPDPVLGVSPCFWTVLRAAAGRPLVHHALVDSWWFTLSAHPQWTATGRMSEAEMWLHYHDGVRWQQLGRSTCWVGMLPESREREWSAVLPEVATAVAPAMAEVAAGARSLGDVVQEAMLACGAA